jgi:ADP-ribosylation factor protein 1
MGGCLSYCKKCIVFMGGLESSGKTTLLYRLKFAEAIETTPTIGFNIEIIEYHDIEFIIRDIGRMDKFKPMWKLYFPDTHAVVFVVDSTESIERMKAAREELQFILQGETLAAHVPLLVFANKQDLPNAHSIEEVAGFLGLENLSKRPWKVQGSCSRTGEGLYEGLDWLRSVI